MPQHDVSIQSPASHSVTPVDTEVKFSGTCSSDVKRLDLMAEGLIPLGSATITGGTKWKFDRKFSSSGLRRIEVTGYGAANEAVASDFVEIVVQPPAVSGVRKLLVSVAASQLGISEDFTLPNNRGDQIRKYHTYCGFQQPTGSGRGADWCFCFLNWVYNQATAKDPDWGLIAYVPAVVAWAKDNGRWIRENDPHVDDFSKSDPGPGDLLIMGDFDFMSSRENYPHIEMVVRVTATQIETIGGNVGDRVQRQTHTRIRNDPNGRYIAGYVRSIV